MDKINFVNNSEPALSAENLNQMQDNMEEVGVVVSPTEPTTNEKVWIQKTDTEKKIYCKNDNGVFEEFVNVETMGIETITNDNGTAIKFPDGTMICRNTVQHTGVSFVVRTDAASNIGRTESSSSFDLGNYAQPFIEKPTLICKGSGEAFAEPLEIYGGDDVNYIGKCYLWSWTLKSNATISISYTAIGRWK